MVPLDAPNSEVRAALVHMGRVDLTAGTIIRAGCIKASGFHNSGGCMRRQERVEGEEGRGGERRDPNEHLLMPYHAMQ